MKKYNEFSKQYIGQSDISLLVLTGCDHYGTPVSELLYFGEDGIYKAYIVEGADVSIGSHYKEMFVFHNWLRIYDDNGLTYTAKGKLIKVYRSGEFGCIIQII